MAIDGAWLARNLGMREPHGFALAGASARSTSPTDRALARELIDFDSDGPEGAAFRAAAPLASTGLSQFVPPMWPSGLAPQPGPTPVGESLPAADVLIVTWTVDEGHALSRVLTPGVDSDTGWRPYTKNFATISTQMRPGCPARDAGRLGTYWTATIGARRVTLFKSDSHLSQDGAKLPNAMVWRQIIADTQPTWVITTGTGGGIGPSFEVGDVIVSRYVAFDCKRDVQAPQRRGVRGPGGGSGDVFRHGTITIRRECAVPAR